MFLTMIPRKSINPVYINCATYVTLQYRNVRLKYLQSNFTIVLKKIPINVTFKRCVNITASLRMSKNYYDVLGISRNANQKQIKDAYYKLAMKHHPDKNQGKLTQQFREIKEAYDVLGNESSRMKYNNSTYPTTYLFIYFFVFIFFDYTISILLIFFFKLIIKHSICFIYLHHKFQ